MSKSISIQLQTIFVFNSQSIGKRTMESVQSQSSITIHSNGFHGPTADERNRLPTTIPQMALGQIRRIPEKKMLQKVQSACF